MIEPDRPTLARVRPTLLAAAFVSSLGGCASQAEHYDDRDWMKEHGVQSGAWREAETLFVEEGGDVDPFNATLRGVRHDLSLRAEVEPDTRCTCLDVAVGRPRDKRFDWADERPTIGPRDLAIALRSEGSQCEDEREDRRPSIQAVDTSGQDVIVVIEELGWDRPQALGAVIPKPGPRGKLVVRPRRKSLPYAHATSGGPRCWIRTDPKRHHQRSERAFR